MKIDLLQLEFIDKNLRTIAMEVEYRFGEKIITSLYRMNDNGVHGQLPLRGIDLRCLNKEHGMEVEKFINSQWEYDYKRPGMKCCMFHTVGQGWHLHLQVHPRTRRRFSDGGEIESY